MSKPLDQKLRSGERVLCREPDGASPWAWHFAGVTAVLLGRMSDPERAGLTLFLLLLLTLLAGRAIATRELLGTAEAAVTDRRLLHLVGENASFRFTEVAADEVAAVEVLGRALRITGKAGGVVVLEHMDRAPELGLALARTAGVAPPWVPGIKERLAEELVVLTASGGAALAYTLALMAQASGSGEALPMLDRLPVAALAVGAGTLGALLGLLAGLALLRPGFSLAGMRAWMRQSPLFAPKPQPGARTGRFARFCLHFVDSLYEAPPPEREQTGRGG